jgi:hypothetical protein
MREGSYVYLTLQPSKILDGSPLKPLQNGHPCLPSDQGSRRLIEVCNSKAVDIDALSTVSLLLAAMRSSLDAGTAQLPSPAHLRFLVPASETCSFVTSPTHCTAAYASLTHIRHTASRSSAIHDIYFHKCLRPSRWMYPRGLGLS